MNEGRWLVLANPNKLKSKQAEWKSMKRSQASSSSSGGVVRQFPASSGSVGVDVANTALQEVGKGVAKGAISALTGT